MNDTPLLERIRDEADLCRNEGAQDIANLLDECAREIKFLRVSAGNCLDASAALHNAPTGGNMKSFKRAGYIVWCAVVGIVVLATCPIWISALLFYKAGDALMSALG